MVDDASENTEIVNLLNAAGIDRAWIGLNDKAVEGTFTWTREDSSVSEVPLGSYAPWGTGQPANANAFQDCVHLVDSGKWASRTCDQEKAFVCEGIAPPPAPPAAPPPAAQFSCFGDIQENKMISSDAISSHSTDTAALAACVNAASCYGISYEPSLAANVRWSARLGGAGVGLFTMQNVDSWVYSGSCAGRRLESEDAEPEEHSLLYKIWVSISPPDPEQTRGRAVVRPSRGPLYGQERL